jgi:hypothetical protein
MMDILLIVGVLGMLCILLAFALEEFARHTRSESIAYNMLNLVGSALLAGYAWPARLWPFIILNLIWFAVAAVKTAQILGRRRSAAGSFRE